jgi:hypothetical protein
MPGDVQDCYTGPAGTADVGICMTGEQTCNDEGTGFGPCMNEVLPQMVDNCSTQADENCDGLACGQALWAHVYGDDNLQFIQKVATDAQGNVYVLGDFAGAMTIGNVTLVSGGNFDVFLAKLGPDGDTIWAKKFGSGGTQQGRGLDVDAAGNIAIAGDYTDTFDFGGPPLPDAGASSDVFVAKLDPMGNVIWGKGFGGNSSSSARGAVLDASGNVVAAGGFFSTIGSLTSAGLNDVWVMKLAAADGAELLAKRFGDASGMTGPTDVAVDGGGNIIMAGGSWSGTLTFGGGPLAAGDFWVAKLDSAGNHFWSKSFVATGGSSPSDLTVDAVGNVIVVGSSTGSISLGGPMLPGVGDSDIFAVKFELTGGHVWSKQFGSPAFEKASSVALDAGGHVLLGGWGQGAIDFGGGPLPAGGMDDAFLAKLTPDGDHVWSKSFGDAAPQTTTQVAASSDGVFCGISMEGIVDFGTGPLTSAGGKDVAIAKLAP